ncbi:hypothetical protein [Geodermatophilus marinus]|nr:hypothetical protein [Geodermatophilus sp. LHW52908]
MPHTVFGHRPPASQGSPQTAHAGPPAAAPGERAHAKQTAEVPRAR